MADDDLRRLERRWRETQEPADEGRYLLARMRAGELSQRALKLAALLGQPGAAAALPEQSALGTRADWAEAVREVASGDPETTWRLLLAECERVLALVRVNWFDSSRLVLVEGDGRGDELPLAERVPLHLDTLGAPCPPESACVSILPEDAPRSWSMQARIEEVSLNGDRSLKRRELQHGDWIDLGPTCLVYDGGADPPRADEIALARAWLDELGARARGAPPSPGELPPLWIGAGLGRDWLRSELRDLDEATTAKQAVSLASWPALGEDLERVQAGAREVAAWALGRSPSARTRALRALDRLAIASPCPLTWDSLTPRPDDPRVRDCGQCQHAVYDLRELTRAEAAELVSRDERVCVRLYRREDGSVMTRDCPSSFPVEAPDDMITLGMLA